MCVASREPRRNIAGSRLSIALIAGAVVVVAAVAVWRASEPGASSTNFATSASESTAVQTSPSAEATLAEIAVITDDFSRNAATYRLARDATREQVEEWLAQVETLPSTPHRYDVARVLYIRFTIIDPEAALDHALRGATKPAWLEAIFRTWAQLDLDAATARASVLGFSAKAAASRAVLQLGLPMTELRSVAEQLDEPEYVDFYHRVEAIDGVAPPTPVQRVLAEVEARNRARTDGESHADAWNRSIAVEDLHVRYLLAEQIALDWAVEDPHAALAALDLLPVDDRVAISGEPYGSSMSVGPLRMLIRERIIWRWAGEDPNATLAWILNREDGESGGLVQLPLNVLAGRDPDGAVALLAAIPQSLRYDAANAVLRMLARRDLDRALGLFATFDIADQSSHAQTLGRYLIENRSAEEALDWAVSLDRRIRARNVSRMITDIHESDRAEAMRLLGSIANPMLRVEAAKELVWRETRRDAHAALTWALDFEPEAERSGLVERVFDTWSGKDPETACRALLEMRGGPLRDQAAAAMMFDVARHDSRLAERLFDAIEAPVERAGAAQTLHWHFSNTEPNPRKAARYRKHLPADDVGTS
ncbi:MAG: hypothetical protein OXH09_12550 [Gammaproteobacteria bacterium]|nr:hypothetical protein [Gammaproteobacteria bacterium]